MTNPLQAFVINAWYKMLAAVGVAVFTLALTVDLKVFGNYTVPMVGLGVAVIGMGEWINHPLQTGVTGNYKITSYNRLSCLLGNLVDVLGFLLIYLGVNPILG